MQILIRVSAFFYVLICASNLCHLELTARMRLFTGSRVCARGARRSRLVSRKKHRAVRPLQGKQRDNVSDRSQVRVLRRNRELHLLLLYVLQAIQAKAELLSACAPHDFNYFTD